MSDRDDVWSLNLTTMRWQHHASSRDSLDRDSRESDLHHSVYDHSDDASRACDSFGGSGRAFHSAVCFSSPFPTPLERACADGSGDSKASAHDADSVSDLIFVFGGRTSGGALTSSLHMIDTADMGWRSLSGVVRGSPPSPREGHAAAPLHSSSMLVYGGYDGQNWLHDLFILDIDTLMWRRVDLYDPSGQVPRGYERNIDLGHAALAASMSRLEGAVAEVQRAVQDDSVAKKSLSSGEAVHTEGYAGTLASGSTPVPLSGHSMSLIDWRLVVLGGTNSETPSAAGTTIQNTHEASGTSGMQVWDTISGSWDRLQAPMAYDEVLPSVHASVVLRALDYESPGIADQGTCSVSACGTGGGGVMVLFGGVHGGPWEPAATRIYSSRLRAFAMRGASSKQIREVPVAVRDGSAVDASGNRSGAPTPRSGHCMVAITPTTAIMFGGWDGVEVKQDTWVLRLLEDGEDGGDSDPETIDELIIDPRIVSSANAHNASSTFVSPILGAGDRSADEDEATLLASATKSVLWDRRSPAAGGSALEIADAYGTDRKHHGRGPGMRKGDGVLIDDLHPSLLFGSDRTGRLAEDQLRLDFVLAILVSLQSTVSDHQRGITDTRASMVGKLAWLEEQRALLQKEVDVFGKEVEKFEQIQTELKQELSQMRAAFGESFDQDLCADAAESTATLRRQAEADARATRLRDEEDKRHTAQVLELLDRVERLAAAS